MVKDDTEENHLETTLRYVIMRLGDYHNVPEGQKDHIVRQALNAARLGLAVWGEKGKDEQ